ncbi:unnamed protein product [Ectocarpus fasciculatus]
MRIVILTFLTVLTVQSLFGQLPEFQTNVSDTDFDKSIILDEFGTKYQQIVSFTSNSYWNKGYREFYVLLLEENTWIFKKLSVKLNEENHVKKSKTKKLHIDINQADDFVSFLSEVDFWNFNEDSLNLNKKDQGNDRVLMKSITDGRTDKFLIRNGANVRSTWAYEADQLQEFVPTEQRRKFIEARNRFYELIKQS